MTVLAVTFSIIHFQVLLMIGRAQNYRWVNGHLVSELFKCLATVNDAGKPDQVSFIKIYQNPVIQSFSLIFKTSRISVLSDQGLLANC